MKSSATPRVARMTGQPMVNSFFTSSPSPWADLMGGMVPAWEYRRESGGLSELLTMWGVPLVEKPFVFPC